RYRELVGESLADGAEFGLILEDDDGLRQVGTRTGVIEVVHTFDDGRMNVLVEGRERFRIVTETEGRSYRTAEVELLEDDAGEEPTDEETERTLEAFRRLAGLAEGGGGDSPRRARRAPRAF